MSVFAPLSVSCHCVHRSSCHVSVCTALRVMSESAPLSVSCMSAPLSMSIQCLDQSPCHVSVRTSLRVMSVSAPLSVLCQCLHRCPCHVSVCTSFRAMSVFAPVSVSCQCLHQSPCHVSVCSTLRAFRYLHQSFERYADRLKVRNLPAVDTISADLRTFKLHSLKQRPEHLYVSFRSWHCVTFRSFLVAVTDS